MGFFYFKLKQKNGVPQEKNFFKLKKRDSTAKYMFIDLLYTG